MIHVVGLWHTRFDDVGFSHCAFSAKLIRWVEMMESLGRECTVYWGGDEPVNTIGVTDYVSILSDLEQEKWCNGDLADLNIDWDPETMPWRIMNHRVTSHLLARYQPGDMVAIVNGSNHDVVQSELPDVTFIEPWIGYTGVSLKSVARCFESYAWMHHIYGRLNVNDGIQNDTVIPNFLRPGDFHTGVDEGYLLYVGRMVQRKGIEDAVAIADCTRLPLVMAGAGADYDNDGILVCDDGTRLEGDIDYRGVVGPSERADLYSHASATLCPTRYIEPFGTVHAEALMSGVWPITTDWGVFTETLPSWARVRTIPQAVEAVAKAIDRRGVTDEGVNLANDSAFRFSMDACAKRYDEWLGRIQ